MSGICPNPENSYIGLRELLVNAIEHGSFGITYDEKSYLKKNDAWDAELKRRQSLPEYIGKYVTVHFKRNEDEIRFLIKDEGSGFNWRPYLEFDFTRAFDPNGRGIFMAKTLGFDFLEYHGIGNEVLAVIYTKNSVSQGRD
ncbi:hypothetical protein CCP3SC15_970005 [Gammaproteobacteria bacterium]